MVSTVSSMILLTTSDEYLLYSGVRVIASRILHEICLLIGKLVIRRTNLTLFVRLGTKSDLLIEQYILLLEQLLIGEHYCTINKYRDIFQFPPNKGREINFIILLHTTLIIN